MTSSTLREILQRITDREKNSPNVTNNSILGEVIWRARNVEAPPPPPARAGLRRAHANEAPPDITNEHETAD